MSDYIPKRWPVYTIDPEGRIREYHDVDAWLIMKRPEEQRTFIKDLPKNYEDLIYESWGYLDT